MGCMESYNAAYDLCPYCGYEDGQPARELLHIPPGTVLKDRYVIGRALGYGGFGVTYIGWDKQLKRKLAIKEYLPSEFATRMIHQKDLIVSNSEKKRQQYADGLKKFMQEGQKLAQVSNVDGIVHMYDCFEANNTAYITMEHLEGETLAAFLEREGKVSEQQAMDLIIPVLQALEAVHEKGIIHRDIAPDNIFLARSADGELKVKLIDFGAAKFATTSHSKSLTVIIKPGYSPEEQYRSNGDQGTYTDVYALAAVLYRMVTGVQPADAFERRTMIETKKKDPLAEPAKYNRDLSANFEIALLNAMNVRIEDRTATIAQFEEELISFAPVKRRGSSIRRIDFMRWPLWAKIGVPIGSAASLCLLIWGLIVTFSNPVSNYELPEGMTRVPDFITADFEQAKQWAAEANLQIGNAGAEYVPNADENVVLLQDVFSGTVVLDNSLVSVIVSIGEESYPMPDVTGMSLEDATKMLDAMNLEIETVSVDEVPGLASGCVAVQSVEPYSEIKGGSSVTLNITSSGTSSTSKAVNFVGMSLDDALKAAEEACIVLRVTERIFTNQYADTQVLTQSLQKGTDVTAGQVVEVTLAASMRQFTMPNLMYKSREQAVQLLKNIGISCQIQEATSEIVAKGLVADQSIEKDQTVTPGDAVELTISTGSKPFKMPNVVGMSEEDARQLMGSTGLVVSVSYDYDKNIPVGTVMTQSVAEGESVTRGTGVTIVVCSTDGLVRLADVYGMTADEAQKLLEKAGLHVRREEAYSTRQSEKGTVVSQLPEPDSYQKPGTVVVLTVSKGAQWSDMVMSLPEGVNANDYEIETVTRYRSRVRETTTSTSSSLSGWTQYDKTSAWGNWGSWSSWSTTPATANDSTKVEKKTQYRYKDKIYTTSTSSSLSGWTLYDQKTEWGDYGSWSSWSDAAVSGSDSRQVETASMYRYYTFICPHCGARIPYQLSGTDYGICYSEFGGCGATSGSVGYSIVYLSNPPSDATYWKYNKRYLFSGGLRWFINTGDDPVTVYRYRDRSQVTTYYYWKWDNWSSWSDSKYTASDSRQVESRTVYRYCTRSLVWTYYYERYGAWGEWQDNKITETAAVDVESGTFYRYRRK